MEPIYVDLVALGFILIWALVGWSRGFIRIVLDILVLAAVIAGSVFFYSHVADFIDIFYERNDTRHWILSLVGTVIACASVFALLIMLVKATTALLLPGKVVPLFDKALGSGLGITFAMLLTLAGDAAWVRIAGVESVPIWLEKSITHQYGKIYGDMIIVEVDSWNVIEYVQEAIKGSEREAGRLFKNWKERPE